MGKYEELKELSYSQHFEGIDYVFGQEQLNEYFKRTGYTQEDIKSGKLVGDGFGGIGTREAFAARDRWFLENDDKIRKQCTAEEIFVSEWWNHECGYTGEYMQAVNIARHYFPKYIPSCKLLNKLQKQFDEIN